MSDNYDFWQHAELLGRLTTRQRAAIPSIVQRVYILGEPWPALFCGHNRICAASTYYRRGTCDPETGERKGFGWAYDPDFQAALKQAIRVVFQS